MASSDEDDKKPPSTLKRYLTFGVVLVIILITVPVYYGWGGLILYACKVAQSNVLPDDMKCYPYVDTKPEIDPITTSIFTTNTDPQMSMKLKIPYDKYNSSNSILDKIRIYKNNPDSHFLVNYFASIVEKTLWLNYYISGYFLNKLNSWPEQLLIVTGPIIFSILAPIITIINTIYLVYLWFAEMSWFFKDNTNETDKGKPKWGDVSIFSSPLRMLVAIGLLILFTMLLIFGSVALPIYVLLSFWICIGGILSFTSEMNDKPTTSLTIVKELFRHCRVQIMYIFIALILLAAFVFLPPAAGVGAFILIIVLLVIGTINLNPIDGVGLSILSSYKQAKRTCFTEQNEPVEKHGWLYRMIFGSDNYTELKGGGNIKNELKSIGRKLTGK